MSTLSRLISCLVTVTPGDDLSWGDSPTVRLRKHRSSDGHFIRANEAFVGSWVGEKFRSVVGYAHDISSRGARILTTEASPIDHIWMALAKPKETSWCPVKVIEVRKSRYGLFQVGLAFTLREESNTFKALRRRFRWA
jgi:hypothetical protein